MSGPAEVPVRGKMLYCANSASFGMTRCFSLTFQVAFALFEFDAPPL
jgi:hypothetical protein